MKKAPLLQTENRVWRTYCGGRNIDRFLGNPEPRNSNQPENWISSFVEAKNPHYIPGEGITRVVMGGKEIPITEAVAKEDFGPGRQESGVLIKLLDAAERLGIQVHPTPEFSRIHFGTDYGKTECWHILEAEPDAAVYIGFREGITREKWQALYERQDISGMLNALHRFTVTPGDTILVRAGTPHAIDAGCFLLEIQEPTDYTMRAEKITPAGISLTPQQIHYGAGDTALLDCFLYEGLTKEQAQERFFLKPVKAGSSTLVSYEDTPCFALARLSDCGAITPDSFVTVVVAKGGNIGIGSEVLSVKQGQAWFVPYGCGPISSFGAELILCYPPQIQ